MKPIDFKKTEKDLYQIKSTPSIIDVKEIIVIAIDGKGDPNTSAEYAAAIETLYGLSYAIKMGNKAILEYVVPPLEGLWQGNGASRTDKSNFVWTSFIRQPDFVTEAIFETAKKTLAKKKPSLDLTKARLEKIAEGLCVQVMHTGSYDNEPATIATMEKYAIESGYAIDISEARRHHEIYLSDPRKVEPEKLKTIIRHPIRIFFRENLTEILVQDKNN
ncbi:MAG: GyrI-like domain-containing protein [Paludibacter sp.]|jgi:hypothetical protein|nr:GyrI-like domain-containing protein [Paludibacter sp.]